MKVRRSGQGTRVLVAMTALAVLAVAMPVNAQIRLPITLPEVGNPAVLEGHGDRRFLEFHATLPERVNETLEYVWTSSEPGHGGPLTFRPGRLAPDEGPMRVSVQGDTTIQEDELVTVEVRPADLRGGQASGTGTIVNDDFQTVSISADSASITELTASQALFTIKRPEPEPDEPLRRLTVDWRTVDRKGPTFAMPGFDYVPVSRSTVTIPADETSVTVSVSLTNNNTVIDRWATGYNSKRNLMVELIPGSEYRATLQSDRRASVDLVDLPRVRIEDASAVEPADQDQMEMEFDLRLSAQTGADTFLRWSTEEGTAKEVQDFDEVTDEQIDVSNKDVGPIGGLISVPIRRNALATADRTFQVELTNPNTTKVRIDRAVATGTIVDRDEPPTLTVADVVTFQDGGVVDQEAAQQSNKMTFTLRLSRPMRSEDGEGKAKVTVRTVNGTATAPTHYKAVTPEDKEFDHDGTEQIVEVTLENQSGVQTADNHFFLEVTSLQNVALPTDPNPMRARGTILNYSLPDVTFATTNGTTNRTVTEGAKGERVPAVFTVQLSEGDRTERVEVPWRTEDGAAVTGTSPVGSAFAGRDYEAASGTLVFPPGTNSQQIQVMTIGNDGVDLESTRQFHVVLDRPRFGRFTATTPSNRFRRVANARITDSDSVPLVSIDDVEVVEGNSGTRFARFPVRLSQPTDADVLVDYRTFDGTAIAKDPDADYTQLGPTTLVIPAGQTSTTINVPVHGDTRREDNEWFGVLLIEAKNATLDTDTLPGTGRTGPDRWPNVARGTIINDDGPYLTITDVAKLEGDEGTTPFQFTVRLHQPDPDTTLSVRWETRDGTAQLFPADDIPGPDYKKGDGVLHFLPGGTTTRTITVDVIGDDWPERTENFFVDLRTPQPVSTNTAATLFKGTGVGTIINDDGPAMSILDAAVTRSTTDSMPVNLPVRIEGREVANCVGTDCPPRAVRYRTVNGTARAGEHYVAKEGTLTIPHQRNVDLHQGTITVEVLPAASNDPERTFEVELFWPDYASLVKPKATVTLQAGATAPDPDDGGGGGPGPGPGDPGTPGPPGPSDPEDLIARSFGEGRIETAVAVSADHWTNADAAVLATAWRFPDALAGASLAAGLDAPLLLTDKEAVPPVVSAELQRLGVRTVWILGGPSAVSFAVEDSLKDAGYQVVRLHGPDRFATAVEVANAVRLPPSGEVVLALGIHELEHRAWPDALSAGALAASPDQIPTLLTRADEVPAITQQALDQLGARRVLLLGGPAAISPAVEQWLTDNGYEVVRLAGETRFGTSAAVASEALARWGTRALPVVFATGDNFPDGLAAGALAARVNGIVLLAPKDTLERAPEVRTFLEANRSQLTGGRIVGGPAAMSEDVQRQLAAAMGLS